MGFREHGSTHTAGITIRGIPLSQAYPGRVFYVNGGTVLPKNGVVGTNSPPADGTYLRPWATVDYAVGQCTANRGDVILVMPGHSETISTLGAAANGVNPWTLDVAGIAIVGLGAGTARPAITIGGGLLDTAARIDVSAANVTLKNLVFTAAGSLDIVTAILAADSNEFNVEGCEFRDGTTILNFLSILTTSSTDNDSDGLRFADNLVSVLNTTPAAVISILQAVNRVDLTGNYVTTGTTGTGAGGEFLTFAAKILTNVLIADNTYLAIGSTSKTTGIFLTGSGTSFGAVVRNRIASLDTTSELVAETGGIDAWLETKYTGTADKSGKPWPVVDS